MPLRIASSVVLFTLTLFTSATLLFLVELMIAKMILPKFGGTPAVWNSCMVFFQAVLLAGYAYAHAATTWLTPRRQTIIQLVLLALPIVLLVLPVRVADSWGPGENYPVVWLLWLLTFTVGLPFFIISTSAPLLSKWFASTGDPAAKDPYFLYAASNVGSMAALFGYPLLVEPTLSLNMQSWLWSLGYVALLAMTAACALRVWHAPALAPELVPSGKEEKEAAEENEEEDADDPAGVAVKKKKKRKRKGGRSDDKEAITRTPADAVASPPDDLPELAAAPDLEAGTRPTVLRYLYWIALAFVPSSLMLAVTTYLTTDIASMPLLWVLPLGLYLLSFILVFAKLDSMAEALFQKLGIRDHKETNPLLPGFWSSLLWRMRRFGLHQLMVLTLPVVVLLLVFLMVSEIRVGWIGWSFLLHLTALFVVSMVCHGELARTRPATQYLTGYYLCMSFGGVVGGMFNALAAPVIFRSVAEYPIVLVVACLLLPAFETGARSIVHVSAFGRRWDVEIDGSKTNFWIDLGLAAALGVGAIYALYKFIFVEAGALQSWEDAFTGPAGAALIGCLAAGVAAMVLYVMVVNPSRRVGRGLDVLLPLALMILSAQLFFRSPFRFWDLKDISENLGIAQDRMVSVLTFGLPVALCYGFAERSIRFGLGVAAIFLASAFTGTLHNEKDLDLYREYTFYGHLLDDKAFDHRVDLPIHQERSFFGVLKVEHRVPGNYVRLLHGTTLHGEQRRNSEMSKVYAGLAPLASAWPLQAAAGGFVAEQELFDRRNEALTYYHRTGPIGQVYDSLCPRGLKCNVAFIGLGTGTMASYLEPGQHGDIYDIDPAVVRIAQDPKYFTYLRDCRGGDPRTGANAYDIKLGDARLKMREAPDNEYRLIVVDAFSSDAIPVHLITKEAIELYFKKLKPDGILAIHISNRHLRLGPVLGNIAASLDKAAMREYDNDEDAPGKNTSDWVILANKRDDFGALLKDTRWKMLEGNGQSVWTDDFSNIVGVLRWWE